KLSVLSSSGAARMRSSIFALRMRRFCQREDAKEDEVWQAHCSNFIAHSFNEFSAPLFSLSDSALKKTRLASMRLPARLRGSHALGLFRANAAMVLSTRSRGDAEEVNEREISIQVRTGAVTLRQHARSDNEAKYPLSDIPSPSCLAF